MIFKKLLADRFPSLPKEMVTGESKNTLEKNPAIQLYGNRFYSDQTPVEYLAEFLLVFASPKATKGIIDNNKFHIDQKNPVYFPKDRVALKLFSFFSQSKLETRHPAHRQAYLKSLSKVSERIQGNNDDKKEAIQLIQSLLNGFIGIANNRTWVTHTFLPASSNLLAREIDWLHSGKSGAKNIELTWTEEENEKILKYFSHDRHNFMARGGELLFLQLTNLFTNFDLNEILAFTSQPYYQHINIYTKKLKEEVENELTSLINTGTGVLDNIIEFISENIKEYNIDNRTARLGWIPSSSKTESLLFAVEILNICKSALGNLEKLDLLQTLCCLQVLRTLCFQATRLDNTSIKTNGFAGNYVWIVSDNDNNTSNPLRKSSHDSFQKIDNLLFRILRNENLEKPSSYKEADKHGHEIFKKISKKIGLVIPRLGPGARFTLHQGLIRLLVAALIRPNERIRLTVFYQRVFSHYGIAINGEQLTEAFKCIGNNEIQDFYAVTASSGWVEEALKQGGFLIELSDAVSMVMNPSNDGEGEV